MTAVTTAVVEVPDDRPIAREVLLPYCTTATRMSVEPAPMLKLRTTELMKFLLVIKLLEPTDPEPSTKNTSSAARVEAHVGAAVVEASVGPEFPDTVIESIAMSPR